MPEGRTRLTRPMVLFVVALMCLAVVGPVQAGRLPAQSRPDAVYSKFSGSDANGLVLFDRIDANSARVTVALTGLPAGHRFRLVAFPDVCSVPPEQSDPIFKIGLGTPANGRIFKSRQISANGSVWEGIGSLRLMEEEGIYYYCRAPNPLDVVSSSADGAFVRSWDGPARGLVVFANAGNDQIRLTAAFGGLAPGRRHRLVHSPLTCAQADEGDPDQPIVFRTFRAKSNGAIYINTLLSLDSAQDLTVGSARTESVSNNETITCGRQVQFNEEG